MPKPWARYEVNFVNHDKFRAITSNAICLWLEGKNYADDKFTDGLLPIYEVKHWRFYGAKSVALLTTSCGLKPGTQSPYAPLWEIVPDFGFKMHDYLVHNDCREQALERIAKGDAKRSADADRLKKWRADHKAPRETPTETLVETPTETLVETPTERVRQQKPETRNQKPEPQAERDPVSLSSAHAGEISERAGHLLEHYGEWYSHWRSGAKLRLLHNSLEFQDACSLVALWDDARLERLAKIILTTDEEFISHTDRGFRIFALKATWADDRLRAAENGKL